MYFTRPFLIHLKSKVARLVQDYSYCKPKITHKITIANELRTKTQFTTPHFKKAVFHSPCLVFCKTSFSTLKFYKTYIRLACNYTCHILLFLGEQPCPFRICLGLKLWAHTDEVKQPLIAVIMRIKFLPNRLESVSNIRKQHPTVFVCIHLNDFPDGTLPARQFYGGLRGMGKGQEPKTKGAFQELSGNNQTKKHQA